MRATWTDERLDDGFRHIDERFAQVDLRFAQVDLRFAQVDQRFAQIDTRLDGIQRTMLQGFIALAGIQVTGFAAILGFIAVRG